MRTSALRVLETGAVLALLSLAGCGGSSSGGSTATTYSVGGTVLGLKSGSSVGLMLGSVSTTAISGNGTFTFPTQIPDQSPYAVTIGTNPVGQTCGVLDGTGTIAEANVTDVEVYCTDDVSTATLDGTYEMAAFNINNNTAQLFTSVPFDGNGTQGSSTVTTNQAGTTFTTSTDSGGTYTVSTVEALPVLTAGTNDAGAIAGADGDEFLWIDGDVNGGIPPALVVGVNPLQTTTLSTLAGNWITVGLTGAATPFNFEGPLTIGADGSFNGTQATLNVTGAASTQTISGPAGSYAVANNVVSIGGSSGYVSANGEFAILSSVTEQTGGASANYPTLTAAVKQGTGISIANVNGVYSVGLLGYDTATTGYGSVLTLDFDGAGNFFGGEETNNNGTASTLDVTGTYTVSSSGVLTMTDSSGDVLTGGVSADGNVLVAAFVTASSSTTPTILVGFKQ